MTSIKQSRRLILVNKYFPHQIFFEVLLFLNSTIHDNNWQDGKNYLRWKIKEKRFIHDKNLNEDQNKTKTEGISSNLINQIILSNFDIRKMIHKLTMLQHKRIKKLTDYQEKITSKIQIQAYYTGHRVRKRKIQKESKQIEFVYLKCDKRRIKIKQKREKIIQNLQNYLKQIWLMEAGTKDNG
ncbi:unnamed protein product [Paramecium sonneborni]|uniref:Uncharacterized protein n=1 Tax=Paramecium sonneborni TaxID=65129 RepID=A0A8S1RFI5_9CILI|nr:unnamed protein product [Paramecium sonneborni]